MQLFGEILITFLAVAAISVGVVALMSAISRRAGGASRTKNADCTATEISASEPDQLATQSRNMDRAVRIVEYFCHFMDPPFDNPKQSSHSQEFSSGSDAKNAKAKSRSRGSKTSPGPFTPNVRRAFSPSGFCRRSVHARWMLHLCW